jgi:uncharacterized protein YdiU (UPF0061 family)
VQNLGLANRQAAIVMRTAPSHIRFGHFEWFAALGQKTEVKKLADFVIEQRSTARPSAPLE